MTKSCGLQVAKMSSQNLWLGLATCKSSEWVAKNSDTCFSTQNMLKQWETKQALNKDTKNDKNHFQKHIKWSKIFLDWSIYSWAHTHHI